jgi:hypothetical protein
MLTTSDGNNFDLHMQSCKADLNTTPPGDITQLLIHSLREKIIIMDNELKRLNVSLLNEQYKNKFLSDFIYLNMSIRITDTYPPVLSNNLYNSSFIPSKLQTTPVPTAPAPAPVPTAPAPAPVPTAPAPAPTPTQPAQPATATPIQSNVLNTPHTPVFQPQQQVTVEHIEDFFNMFTQQSRFTSKTLDNFKNTRIKFSSQMDLSDYCKMLQSHKERLMDIFKTKGFTEKKIVNIISKSMSALDMRLINYGNYSSVGVDVDERDKLLERIVAMEPSSEAIVPFNKVDFCSRLHNYGIAVFTLRKLIESMVDSSHQPHNIVYVNSPNSSDADPYSFYVLNKVSKNKNKWSMDCRLWSLGNDIITRLKPYATDLFRKLYYRVFSDNTYRNNYTSSTTLTEYDCEQLMQNIILLSDPIKFCNMLREIIKEKCEYTPTADDEFNLKCDDNVTKRMFKEKPYSPIKEYTDGVYINVNPLDSLNEMFDDILKDDAVNLTSKYIEGV